MPYFMWGVKDVHWTLLRAKHNVFNAVAEGQMQTTSTQANPTVKKEATTTDKNVLIKIGELQNTF